MDDGLYAVYVYGNVHSILVDYRATSSTLSQAWIVCLFFHSKGAKATRGGNSMLQRDGPIPDASGNLCRPFGVIITNHHSSL